MPCLREGFPVEAPQPRGKGPQQGVETSSPVIQVHCVHGNIRTGKQSILIVSSSTIDKIHEIYTFYENRYEIYTFYENRYQFRTYFRKKCRFRTYFRKKCNFVNFVNVR